MKALILAAGFGRRLQPITNEIPKSMIRVCNIPLLENALNILVQYDIAEIGIVVGHKADYIRERIGSVWKNTPIIYFENDRYLETNNVYSLYKAADFCNDEMLLLECDLFYEKDVIQKLICGQGDCVILCSKYNPKIMDGTAVEIEKEKISSLILGKWQNKDFDYSKAYKTVNMYKFSKTFVLKYMNLIKWYIQNMGENSYYEKVLGSMIYLQENDFKPVIIDESDWCEIDDAEDLKRAELMFKGK